MCAVIEGNEIATPTRSVSRCKQLLHCLHESYLNTARLGCQDMLFFIRQSPLGGMVERFPRFEVGELSTGGGKAGNSFRHRGNRQ